MTRGKVYSDPKDVEDQDIDEPEYDEDEILDMMHPNETHEEFMEHEDW